MPVHSDFQPQFASRYVVTQILSLLVLRAAMAGLTTASLVGLDDPDNEHRTFVGQAPSRLSTSLGLAEHITAVNACALVSSSLLSISFLVFLNASQPFVLDQLGVDKHVRGHVTGQLVLADELVALAGYLVWGYIADKTRVRWVAAAGHAIVAVALVLFVNAHSVYPGLLLVRMLFASGASALVTALSAALSGMTALPVTETTGTTQTETEPLLSGSDTLDPSALATRRPKAEHSARFSGLLGFSTGLGALIGVTVFLPLPTRLAGWFPIRHDSDLSVQRALKWTFYIVATIAILEAIFVLLGLNIDTEGDKLARSTSDDDVTEKSALASMKDAIRDIGRGFSAAKYEPELALAYVASFASRATSSIATGFIPLLVNHFFTTHGLCNLHSLADSSKETCRPAFTRSSMLTGILQLVSLLLAPLVGILSSKVSQPAVLGLSALVGAASFILFAFLPQGGDPRSPVAWPAVSGMGLSQIGGIVVSLALVAKSRGRLMTSDRTDKREVGGALSAAYSFCGGIGILLIGKIGGSLFDKWVGAPFALVAAADVAVSLVAVVVCFRQRSARWHDSRDD